MHFFHNKNADFSGIRTQIVGIEGQHADHQITNTKTLFIR